MEYSFIANNSSEINDVRYVNILPVIFSQGWDKNSSSI